MSGLAKCFISISTKKEEDSHIRYLLLHPLATCGKGIKG
jgi:hypothetical protein